MHWYRITIRLCVFVNTTTYDSDKTLSFVKSTYSKVYIDGSLVDVNID